MTQLGLGMVILLSILTLFLSQRYALLPLIIAACYMTFGQAIEIATLNFTILRIMIACYWLRLIVRGEIPPLQLNKIDKMLILWVISNVVVYTLFRQTTGAFINRLGFAYNALGLYFIFRFTIRDIEEFNDILEKIAVILLPLAFIMIIEMTTGKNLFSIFGGVPEYSLTRNGSVRCQGPFSHPIMAGTFAASLIPLIISLRWQKDRSKLIYFIGIISALLITLSTHSSGPLITFAFGILGMALWPYRNKMRHIRWALVVSIVLLDLIMKAPVYYLPSRVSDLIGGHGWHRSYLIHQAITYINEWWLMGAKKTSHWMPTTLVVNEDSADITNQFIAQGISGGLITMILFILIIAYCFKMLGKTMKVEDKPFAIKITLWSMGASLLAHVGSFFGVTYFDQIIVIWYMLLAAISTVTDSLLEGELSFHKLEVHSSLIKHM